MKYNIVYADPPYPQKKGGLRSARPNQKRNLDYSTLSLDEIKQFLKEYDGDVLFLGTIDKFLFESQKIAEDLGYKLHARIIWNKENGVAPAFTIRYTTEYLLWFYKKPMLKIDPSQRGKFTTLITEKATIHSKKPIKAYEMIEALYPNKTKIELFARNTRKGWESFGNEVGKFD